MIRADARPGVSPFVVQPILSFMSTDPRENHIDYVEFPAPSADSFAAVKRFYQEVFGWSFQDWGDDYSDTKDSGTTSGFSAAPDHRPAGRSWYCSPEIWRPSGIG